MRQTILYTVLSLMFAPLTVAVEMPLISPPVRVDNSVRFSISQLGSPMVRIDDTLYFIYRDLQPDG